MRVLIVDDEPLARRRLEILLSRRAWIEIAGAVGDGRQALERASLDDVDAVLLDIQMPGLDGLELARRLRDRNSPEIIFVTAYDKHAVEAFKASAVDYLLKPVDPDRLDEALGRARQARAARDAQARADELEALVHTLRGSDSDTVIWLRDRTGQVRIDTARIDWISAEGDYVRIHCGEQSWLQRATLAGYEERLDRRLFLRVHRSHMVNLRRIERVTTEESGAKALLLHGGVKVRVGRNYERALNQALIRTV
ncbi:MAG: LytR/AlgR family response regulator transcription factor [Oceanicaulis sp.]